MPKYKVEWYLDYGSERNNIRQLEIEAINENEANSLACDIIMSHWTIGEITEVKGK